MNLNLIFITFTKETFIMTKALSLTLSLIIGFCFSSYPLQARQPYHALAATNTDSVTVSASNLVDLSRDLRTSSLEVLAPSYTPTSPLAIDINLRGIFALTSFAANSTTLNVSIPQAGTTTSFTGSTRDESLQLFKEYTRDAGRNQRLLRAYAKYSPIDPIAGNPNSLMSLMAQADYDLWKLAPFTSCQRRGYSAQPIAHQFQIGFNPARAFSKGYDTTVVTLPLRYSYFAGSDTALVIDAPLTYYRNGGASSLTGSIGLSVRLPVTSAWSLTSMCRGGTGGSLDLCTSGNFISAAILSIYNTQVEDYAWSLINYVGYFSSTNLWLGGVNFNYRLQNYVIKNGVSLTSCTPINFCGLPVHFNLFFTDTYFTKNYLYIKRYEEIGGTLIVSKFNPYLQYDRLNLGFSYQYGEKGYKAFCLNSTYQF